MQNLAPSPAAQRPSGAAEPSYDTPAGRGTLHLVRREARGRPRRSPTGRAAGRPDPEFCFVLPTSPCPTPDLPTKATERPAPEGAGYRQRQLQEAYEKAACAASRLANR